MMHNELGEPLFHCRGEFTIESGYDLTRDILNEYPQVDGLFCATDKIAIGAIKAATECGRKVGEDIRIVGVGNDELGSVVAPSLTTFSFAFEAAGEKAASVALEVIKEKQQPMVKVVLGFEPVDRQTC
jgi:LacI family sucrose operon transcriptional repressor